MKRFVNAVAWFICIKVLILSLCLLFYDQMQTKKMLLAVEAQRDNAVQLNEVLVRQIERCKNAHTRHP